jgi:hypothetical protein
MGQNSHKIKVYCLRTKKEIDQEGEDIAPWAVVSVKTAGNLNVIGIEDVKNALFTGFKLDFEFLSGDQRIQFIGKIVIIQHRQIESGADDQNQNKRENYLFGGEIFLRKDHKRH